MSDKQKLSRFARILWCGTALLNCSNMVLATESRGGPTSALTNAIQVEFAIEDELPKPDRRTANEAYGRAAASQVVSQSKSRASLQPANSIMVRVRYSKQYGYRGTTSAFGNVGPTSCDAFSVSADAGEEYTSARSTVLISISTDSIMVDVGDQYVCSYLVSELPLDRQIRVSVTLSNVRGLTTEMWKSGIEAQPPQGQERRILDGKRVVTLTVQKPRAALGFEMVYASRRLKNPDQPVPQSRQPPVPAAGRRNISAP